MISNQNERINFSDHNLLRASWISGYPLPMPLWIDWIARLVIPPHGTHEHFIHPVTTFELVEDGVLCVEYRNTLIELHRGDCVLLAAGEYNRLFTHDEPCTKLVAAFVGPQLGLLCESLFRGHNMLNLDEARFERVRTLMHGIAERLQAQKEAEKISGASLEILLEAAHAAKEDAPFELTQAIRYLETHITRRIDWNELARTLHLSPNRLNAIFRQNYQTSPARYFFRMRMEKSAALLAGSRLTVKEIAELTGYGSGLTLAREFKKYHGMLPLEFRERVRKYTE